MVGFGMLMFLIIGLVFFFNFCGIVGKNKLLFKVVLWFMLLLWIVIEVGWFLVEFVC